MMFLLELIMLKRLFVGGRGGLFGLIIKLVIWFLMFSVAMAILAKVMFFAPVLLVAGIGICAYAGARITGDGHIGLQQIRKEFGFLSTNYWSALFGSSAPAQAAASPAQAAGLATVQAAQKAVFLDAEVLGERLKQKVIGQDMACIETAKVIARRGALIKRTKPMAMVLYVGPPGTGKTYLAKMLAKELNRPLIAADMTQFGESHAVSQLFGPPPGYCGSDKPPILAGGLQDHADAVVLLDEIEKAHKDVQVRFLTAFNDGYLTHASTNARVDCTKSIWCITTNAAQDEMVEIAKQYAGNVEAMTAAAKAALQQAKFNDALLSRIDRIVIFQQLEGLNVARVAALEIEAMVEAYGLKISENGIDIEMLLGIIDRQNKLGTSATTRDITRAAEDELADSCIDCVRECATHVEIIQIDGKFRAVPGLAPDANLKRTA